jgi:hypothetical protein
VIEPEYGGLPVTVIFPGAFKGRRDLLTVEIPEGVEEIGDEAFLGCSGLDTVYLPDSITKIGPRAFKECSFLTAVRLPEHVEALHYSVFDACRSLAAIDVPVEITAGSRDLIRHSAMMDICRKIPNATFTLFEGEDHGSYIVHSAKIADHLLGRSVFTKQSD